MSPEFVLAARVLFYVALLATLMYVVGPQVDPW